MFAAFSGFSCICWIMAVTIMPRHDGSDLTRSCFDSLPAHRLARLPEQDILPAGWYPAWIQPLIG